MVDLVPSPEPRPDTVGEVVGLVNASGLAIGETLYLDEPIVYPRIPAFAPELFATARPKDVSRTKQFRRGLEQLEREGVIQVLRRPGTSFPAGHRRRMAGCGSRREHER